MAIQESQQRADSLAIQQQENAAMKAEVKEVHVAVDDLQRQAECMQAQHTFQLLELQKVGLRSRQPGMLAAS